MEQLDFTLIQRLRSMVLDGLSPSVMFKTLKGRLGDETHILTILHYFQQAFCLDLSEVKPFASLSRAGTKEVHDEAFLDELVMPAIIKHQLEWNVPSPTRPSDQEPG